MKAICIRIELTDEEYARLHKFMSHKMMKRTAEDGAWDYLFETYKRAKDLWEDQTETPQ